ncbi:MAG: hypothetical protein DYH15_01085 [Nitrosomonas sp. PRO4]|nr:hypothetical protein [Nitrosomonas sp. PRO4]
MRVKNPFMSKFMLVIFLILVSNYATGEWTRELSFETDEAFTYTDYATIKKVGNFVKIWTLTDFKNPQMEDGYSYLSQRQQVEYDCENEKFKLITFSRFPDNMLQGKIVFHEEYASSVWLTVPPNTILAYYLELIVCDKHNLELFTQAEWLKVDQTNDAVYYIDPIILYKKNRLKYIWQLIDYLPRKSEREINSTRIKMEYDCEEKKVRLLHAFHFSDSMGTGYITQSILATSYVPVPVPVNAKINKIFSIICD